MLLKKNTEIDYFHIDEDLAMDSMPSDTDLEAINWQMKKELQQKLIDYPSLLDSSEILQTFFDNTLNTNIGKFVSLEQNIKMLSDTNNQLLMDSNYVIEIVNEADSLNNAVSPNLLVEENEKAVNAVFLETVALGITVFTPAQKQIIEPISIQCPFTGGNAIFRARGIRAFWNDTIDYNDEVLCAALETRLSGKNIKPMTHVSVQFYPNPSNGLVRMDYDLGEYMNSTLEIANVLGQIVFRKKLYEKSNIILLDLSKLSDGIYHYNVFSENSSLVSGNISILK